jgi:hypothetical protein
MAFMLQFSLVDELQEGCWYLVVQDIICSMYRGDDRYRRFRETLSAAVESRLRLVSPLDLHVRICVTTS